MITYCKLLRLITAHHVNQTSLEPEKKIFNKIICVKQYEIIKVTDFRTLMSAGFLQHENGTAHLSTEGLVFVQLKYSF
jgi:hypothetical protein